MKGCKNCKNGKERKYSYKSLWSLQLLCLLYKRWILKPSGYCNSAHIVALTGLRPRKMAEGLQNVSALCGNAPHLVRLTATRLDHYDIDSHRSTEIKMYESSYLTSLNRLVILRLLELNLKARQESQDIQEFFTTSLFRCSSLHWT